MSKHNAIIVAARRTAIGKIGGAHSGRRLEDLAAPVIAQLLKDAKLPDNMIDEVILGNAVGGGGNPARRVALAAGLPEYVSAITIDRQCASALDAITIGARQVACGMAQAIIAGGVEAASTAPWRVEKPANLYTDLPRFFDQARFTPEGQPDPGMIEAAEAVARHCGISREQQDECALESHHKAIAAEQAGYFAQEIVALGPDPQDQRDEAPRANMSLKLLSRMRPLANMQGTVTAGNSCQISDGAACVLIISDAIHQKLGKPPGLAFIEAATAGYSPQMLGLAAIPAAHKLAKYQPFDPAETVVEINEAFASQTLATRDQLNLSPGKTNIFGGALAYGHPYGASGAVLVTRLFTRLLRTDHSERANTGLALIAAAGGLGTAALFKTTFG